MNKEETLLKIKENGVMAVIRGESLESALKIVDSCVEAGLISIELAFTTPLPHRAIESIAQKYPNAILGAGTILDATSARIAILSGASYIVSPHFDEEIAKLTNTYSIPYIAGCMTIKEIVTALSFGVSIIKAFPGDLLTPAFIKDVKGPLPNTKIIPTGGVDLNNMKEWFDAGAYSVGIASALVNPLKKDPNDFKAVKENALKYVERFREIKNGK